MNDKETMQMALDALENHTAIKHPQQREYRDAAIEALRAALARPEREWVGLTGEEIDEIMDDVIGFNSCFGAETDFARAIEAELKEKNG